MVFRHLRAAGYLPVAAEEELPETQDYDLKIHHSPRIYSLDWPAPVELHVHPLHLPIARLLGSKEVVRDATPLNRRRGDCLLPSPTHFVMHNVIHAFVWDKRDLEFLSLRQLFEFVRTNRTYSERIDWAVIQQRFDSLGYGSALRGYVVLSNAYLGFQVPPELPISGFARLWRRFYRIELEHPVMHFLFSLGRFLRMPGTLVRRHAHNLRRNPRSI